MNVYATTKQALFGGALFTAGITATAQAQWTINPGLPFSTKTRVLAVSNSSSLFIDITAYGTSTTAVNFDSYNDPVIGGSASAIVSYAYVGAYLNTTSGTGGVAGNAFAYVLASAAISVAFDKKVQAEWDFTGMSGGISIAYILAFDLTTSTTLLGAAEGTFGSLSIDLQAGHDYLLQVTVRDDTESTIWGSFTKAPVPAPGSLTLLGVAALGVRRRRRM